MILIDSSIWIDHIRRANPILSGLLENDRVLLHPFVIGEIAMGSLSNRLTVIAQLSKQRQIAVVIHEEVMTFIEANNLFGIGIGYVDAHLLASVKITPHAQFWTRDNRLAAVAARFHLAFLPN
jgi:predicted nucleic acid-binding protein